MPLTKKEIHDLNNMNRAAQNVKLGDIVNENNNVPESTIEDNGKFLRVVNGMAKWENVPSANGVKF